MGIDTIQHELGLDHKAGLFRKHRLWITIVAILLVAAFSFFIFLGSSDSKVTYIQKEAQKGDLIIRVTATGTLQPTNQVDVGVEVSGTIKTVEVDYNQRVEQGQVLARLDTSKLSALVLQSRAALEAAQGRVKKARADLLQSKSKLSQYKKARKASGGRIPSQAELDAAEAAFARARAEEAIAQADVSKASAELEYNESNLSKATIVSPIKGVVLQRHVEPGQTVAASLQTPVLFTIAEDLRTMDLHVDIDEADVAKIGEGQSAEFGVDAWPDRRFDAKVVQLRYAPKRIEGVVTYETVLRVDNPDLLLLPGMTATADIVVLHLKERLLIPNAALRFTPQSGFVEKKRNKGLLGALLPRRRHRNPNEDKSNTQKPEKTRRVWILKDNRPTPLRIQVANTDGRMTEVISGDIKPGLQVLTGIVRKRKE